MMYVAELTWLG